MEFKTSDRKFDIALENALKNPEISKFLSNSNNTSIESLRRIIERRKELLWASLSSEIQAYNSLFEHIKVTTRNEGALLHEGTFYKILGTFNILLNIIFGVFLTALMFYNWLKIEFLSFFNVKYSIPILGDFELYKVALLLFLILYSFIGGNWIYTWNGTKQMKNFILTMKNNSFYLKKKLTKLEQEINAKLSNEIIVPELISLLNQSLNPSTSKTLKHDYLEGLGEVHNDTLLIKTKSQRKLINQFETMPGGSIGISGPRGIGKSSLIKSFINFAGGKIKEKEILSTYVNAPVNYELRDFVIHFSQKIIDTYLIRKGRPFDDRGMFEDSNRTSSNEYIPLLNKVIRLFAFTGIAILSIGLILGYSQVTEIRSKINDTLEVLGFSIGTLIKAGIILLLITAVYRFLYNQIILPKSKRNGYEMEPDDTVRLSQSFMTNLKYQQGYTSGWSGSLKFPVGLKNKLSESSSINVVPLSLPQIISRLKSILKEIGKEYVLVASIDEIDKMESKEDVIEFFNEIKSLFGVPNCFYLVSVSEEALSSFESRGILVKDVFDSSFDDILKIGYFSFEENKNLIQKRVINLPLPFILFSHSFSAGIPREMIRTVRSLIEIGKLNSTNNFDTIISVFIDQVIRNHVRSLFTNEKLKSAFIGDELSIDLTCLLNVNSVTADDYNLLIDEIETKLKDFESSIEQNHEIKKAFKTGRLFTKLLNCIKGHYINNLDLDNNFNAEIEYCEKLAFGIQVLKLDPSVCSSTIHLIIKSVEDKALSLTQHDQGITPAS